MAVWQGPGGSPITGINVTPLVDITLVLLVVFMVTAKLIVGHHALVVDLPRAATGQDVQQLFAVRVSASGALEIEGERIDDDALLRRAGTARRRHEGLRAVIDADAGVAHGRVMRVLDLLRQAGVSRIGFGVVTPPSASSQAAHGAR
jgi:biopolymer transport protein ExbD